LLILLLKACGSLAFCVANFFAVVVHVVNNGGRSLNHHLLNVRLDLRGQQLSQLRIQLVLLRKLTGQLIRIVTLKDFNVFMLIIADVDGDSQ
jgi:hypothetical protein